MTAEITVLVKADASDAINRIVRFKERTAIAAAVAQRITDDADVVALGVRALAEAAATAATAALRMELSIAETEDTPPVTIEIRPSIGQYRAVASILPGQLDLFH